MDLCNSFTDIPRTSIHYKDGRFAARSREDTKPRYSGLAELPVKFQSEAIIITSNLAAWRLHEIWRYCIAPELVKYPFKVSKTLDIFFNFWNEVCIYGYRFSEIIHLQDLSWTFVYENFIVIELGWYNGPNDISF